MRTLIAVLCILMLSACASTSKPRPPAPTVEEIVQMSKDKVAPEEIIQRMRDARAVYRLSGSELADLKTRGVSDAVLDHMLNTRIAAERAEEYFYTRDRYMFYGWPGYGPFWGPYPYPHYHVHPRKRR